MKKIILFVAIALMGVYANAQQGQMAVGLNLSFTPSLDNGMPNNPGITAKFQYSFSKVFRAELFAGYDFENQSVSIFQTGENFHFLINLSDKFKVYPIVGLGYALTMVDFGKSKEKESHFMANGGLGAEYAITDHWSTDLEVKYQFIDDCYSIGKSSDGFSRLPISLGVTYRF